MCCGETSVSAPEYLKRFKPENSAGCCCKGLDDCKYPSRAIKDTPLWNWEQEYGRIINQITEEIGEDGRWHLNHVKTTCPKKKKIRSKGCCILSYKVTR